MGGRDVVSFVAFLLKNGINVVLLLCALINYLPVVLKQNEGKKGTIFFFCT